MLTRRALLVMVATVLIVGFSNFTMGAQTQDRDPRGSSLSTKWTEHVNHEKPLPEYPRPQLVRRQWLNLNGVWQLCVGSDGPGLPDRRYFNRKILVPFPIESYLSGIGKHFTRFWYRTTFSVPLSWKKKRVMIHFGAANWYVKVFINRKQVGEHEGGYDSFSFDITDYLRFKGLEEMLVSVYSPVDSGDQPRGKQVLSPRGIWYTSSSGIWQTVWLEPVSPYGVKQLLITPDLSRNAVHFQTDLLESNNDLIMKLKIYKGSSEVFSYIGEYRHSLQVSLKSPIKWSPSNPFLYHVKLSLILGHKVIDKLQSYFGMREVAVIKDSQGRARIALNGKPIFEMGVLDQGFWPDGLYTAPSDQAIRHDLSVVRHLGFNLIRKHVKVEPERWYYWCDKMGILVWQDMPSGSNSSTDGKREFRSELGTLVTQKYNHPCIINWILFNEGWGEFGVSKAVEMVRSIDPTRLVEDASGWHHYRGLGNIIDIHRYPEPEAPEPDSELATVVGEFGGLSLAIPGHLWTSTHWGYKQTSSRSSLSNDYINLLRHLWVLVDEYGLSGAVYTQLTDVETETNGLMTYDRRIIKVNQRRICAANKGLFPRIHIACKDSEGLFKVVLQIPPGLHKEHVKICYTVNGSDPMVHGKTYQGPFLVKHGEIIMARLLKNGMPFGLLSSGYADTSYLKANISISQSDLVKGVSFEYYKVHVDTTIEAPRA
ncbi:MAG: sugar-binding domain-containing protein, partial [Candidatus Kryptoniota bacterium]